MPRLRTLPLLVLPVILAVSIGASPSAAQSVDDPWTTVGSAGTVDEADLLVVQLGTPVPGAVSLRPGLPLLGRTAHIRYNVVAVRGILGTNGLGLSVRFLDRGDVQRVVVRLKEYGLNTGLTTTLMTLDSDAFAPSNSFQVQRIQTTVCDRPFTTLNFVENAYFMDVELSNLSQLRPPIDDPPVATTFALVEPAGLGPALAIIKLDNQTDCIK
jgi:hypothetical protein